jgi:hypothetical protein
VTVALVLLAVTGWLVVLMLAVSLARAGHDADERIAELAEQARHGHREGR